MPQGSLSLLPALVSTESLGSQKSLWDEDLGNSVPLEGSSEPTTGLLLGRVDWKADRVGLGQGCWAGAPGAPGNQCRAHTSQVLIPYSSWALSPTSPPRRCSFSFPTVCPRLCQPPFEPPQVLDSHGSLRLRGGERETSRRVEGSKILLLWKSPYVPLCSAPNLPL